MALVSAFLAVENENRPKSAGGKSSICRFSFLAVENENRQMEDLPPADFGRLPERLPLSVRTKSIDENFVN